MLSIREERPAQPIAGFIQRDVEPLLNEQELVVFSGLWPGRAMVRSTVVLQSSTLVAVHVTCYPRYGFTELWRYYACQEGVWRRRTWQQLPIADRLRILEAYEYMAPAFARHPGNIPGRLELSRSVKRGPTYLLVALQKQKLVHLTNENAVYTLEKQFHDPHAWYFSYPDREILLIKWHQAAIPSRSTAPFLAAVVECEIGGDIQFSGGLVASRQLCPKRILDQFLATPRESLH